MSTNLIQNADIPEVKSDKFQQQHLLGRRQDRPRTTAQPPRLGRRMRPRPAAELLRGGVRGGAGEGVGERRAAPGLLVLTWNTANLARSADRETELERLLDDVGPDIAVLTETELPVSDVTFSVKNYTVYYPDSVMNKYRLVMLVIHGQD